MNPQSLSLHFPSFCISISISTFSSQHHYLLPLTASSDHISSTHTFLTFTFTFTIAIAIAIAIAIIIIIIIIIIFLFISNRPRKHCADLNHHSLPSPVDPLPPCFLFSPPFGSSMQLSWRWIFSSLTRYSEGPLFLFLRRKNADLSESSSPRRRYEQSSSRRGSIWLNLLLLGKLPWEASSSSPSLSSLRLLCVFYIFILQRKQCSSMWSKP